MSCFNSRTISVVAVSLVLGGCVTKVRYDDAVDTMVSARDDLAASQEQVAALVAELSAVQQQLENLQERHEVQMGLVETLDQRNAQLLSNLDEVSGRMAELRAVNRQDQIQKAELEALIGRLKTRSQDIENEMVSTRSRVEALEAEATRLAEENAKLVERRDTYDSLIGELKAELDAGRITISNLSGKVVVQVSNAIIFDSGSSELKDEGRAALTKVATALAQIDDREIRVEGHTDDRQLLEGAPYADNWALSAQRASTVVSLLVANGVKPTLIAAVGFGEFQPVASNDDPEGRAANRRTEIVLIPRLERHKKAARDSSEAAPAAAPQPVSEDAAPASTEPAPPASDESSPDGAED